MCSWLFTKKALRHSLYCITLCLFVQVLKRDDERYTDFTRRLVRLYFENTIKPRLVRPRHIRTLW